MRAYALAAALLASACLPTTEDAGNDAGSGQMQPPGGGSAGAHDSGAPPFGGTPNLVDAGTPEACVADEQCEPGYFCDRGRCEPAPDPACERDEDCDGGQLCRDGACVEAPPPPVRCEGDVDCDADEHCDASSGDCRPGARCVRDDDCPESALCLGRLCSAPLGPCRTDRDCPEATICEEAACIHEPIPCETDRDCPEATICDTGNCLPGVPPCETDRDCPEGTICEAGECVPESPRCRDDADCGPDQRCLQGDCRPVEPPECGDDADCPLGMACVEGVCHPSDPGCVEDTDCAGDEVCRDGACVPDLPDCLDDGDCGPEEVCRQGLCAPAPACEVDDDCFGGDVCDGGICVAPPPECVADRDCAAGEVCRAGACVPEAGPDCDADLDCAAGRICVRGACALPAEPVWRACNARAANPGCPVNALCIPIESCLADAAACDGLCAPSTCDACTPGEACGGVAAACIPGSPAAFCITAGEAGLGEPCSWSEGLHCARGLMCTFGLCRQPCGGADCGSGGEACPAGEDCIDLSSENGGRPFSICHHDCDLFAQRGCAAGEACRMAHSFDDTGDIVGSCDDSAPSGRLTQNQACVEADDHSWGNCRADHLCTSALTPDAPICYGFCTRERMQNCVGASRCTLGALDGFPALGVCVGNCDPWGGAPGCGAGRTCQLATIGTAPDGGDVFTGLCLPGTGALALGDDCVAAEPALSSDCVVGSICADVGGFFGNTCVQFCDTNDAEHGCPAGQACATQVFGSERPEGASPNLGICQ